MRPRSVNDEYLRRRNTEAGLTRRCGGWWRWMWGPADDRWCPAGDSWAWVSRCGTVWRWIEAARVGGDLDRRPRHHFV